ISTNKNTLVLSGCLVDCIVYAFNKITKSLNNKTTILNIDILHFPTAVGTERLFIVCGTSGFYFI
ncbi:MAG: hypothetical protein KIG82_03445, partial [Prevotella sp.]|nr:hypothetical protein [Prevotella sp.]